MSRIAAAALLLFLAHPAYAQPLDHSTKGYQSRACGFDMDDDGVVGEAGDDGCTAAMVNAGTCDPGDCNVCDGVTTDPDGDGNDEDIHYVDCNSGSDAAAGTAAAPWRTLSKALSSNNGPGDGDEDIICVRSTCSWANGSAVNALSVDEAGVTGQGPSGLSYVVKAASGSEVFDFRYPADPFMIVGWDTDNDGEYPPYDTNQSEPFIVDATCSSGDSCPLADRPYYDTAFNMGIQDGIELAHMTVKNYGRERSSTTHYAFRWGSLGSGSGDYHYLHDIHLDSINRGIDAHSDRRGLDFRLSSTRTLNWASFENLKFTNTSAWPARGSNNVSTNGSKWRFQHISYTDPVVFSTSAQVQPFKLWRADGLEFLDSYFEMTNADTSGQTSGIYYNKGVSNSHIIGNSFLDVSNPITISYKDDDSNGNVGRILDNVYIRRNYALYSGTRACLPGCRDAQMVRATSAFTDDTERSATGTESLGGGAGGNSDPTCSANIAPTYMGTIEVSDNVVDFGSDTEVYGFISYQNGSNCGPLPADAGPLTVNNNTILNYNPSSSGDNYAAFVYGHSSAFDWDFKYVSGKIYHFNNLVRGGSGEKMVTNEKAGEHNCGPGTGTCANSPPGVYGTADFFADNNIYVSNPIFTRGGTQNMSLSTWRSQTTEDGLSTATCSPSLSGYLLQAGDLCAINKGNNTYCSDLDIEEDDRDDGSCDIGADEYDPGTNQCAGECNTAADCNDGNVCTTDTCTGCPTVCSHTNNTNSCSDGLYCNGADTCASGSCSTHAGTPCPGADGDSDCSEVCNEATDSCTANDPDDSACDDGLYCTVTDTCSSGTCVGTTDPCTHNPALDDCTQACNEATDDCTATSTDGLACNDGEFCTEPDACDTGNCTGPALDCSASSTSCKTGTCDEGTDACISGANKPDGTECNDGVFCNGADECSSGDCTVHAGDPCVGGPNPICTEATDSCSAYTESGGMVCYGCYCAGCYVK